jgi:hypothetical protein
MIFARRALQRCLNELREAFNGDAVDKLAARLNRPGKDRLAAMWEAVVFHALAKHGTLRNEVPLPSGRCPDLSFDDGALRFTADITVVSDEGLDDDNPYDELSDLIEAAKTKLGLPIGGLDLQVKSKDHHSARGIRTTLRLPPRSELPAFVRDRIMPSIRSQMSAGEKLLRITIDDDEAGVDITIDPTKSPYSTGSFGAYYIPKIKDRNPLYNALRAKVGQLRGADGITGVIVGDGDCTALADRRSHWSEVPARDIVEEFLRQYSSIDFVLLLMVRERSRQCHAEPAERWVHPMLVVRRCCQARDQLDALIVKMLSELPKPVAMPVNAALRAREPGYDLGHHGGCTVGRGKIRISSRELMEILAGLRTLEDNGAKYIEASRKMPRRPNPAQIAFLHNLQEGRLPAAISVIKTGEDDGDDWVEFEFGSLDPAISPLS